VGNSSAQKMLSGNSPEGNRGGTYVYLVPWFETTGRKKGLFFRNLSRIALANILQYHSKVKRIHDHGRFIIGDSREWGYSSQVDPLV